MRLDKVDQFIKSILFINIQIVKLQISQLYKFNKGDFILQKVNKILGWESNSGLKVVNSFSRFKLLIEKSLNSFYFLKNRKKDIVLKTPLRTFNHLI